MHLTIKFFDFISLYDIIQKHEKGWNYGYFIRK